MAHRPSSLGALLRLSALCWCLALWSNFIAPAACTTAEPQPQLRRRSLRSLSASAPGSSHAAPDSAVLEALEADREVRARLHNVSAIMTGNKNWSSSEFVNASHRGGREAAAERAPGRNPLGLTRPAGLGASKFLDNFLDGAEVGDPVASFVEVSEGVRVALGAAASVTGGVGAGVQGMPVVFSPTTQCVMCSYILEQADRKIKEIPRWSNGGGYFPGTSNFAPGTQRGYYRNYAETTAMLELAAQEQQRGQALDRRARISVGAGVRAGATQGRSTRTSTGHFRGGLTASAFDGAGVASGLAGTGGGIGRGGMGGMGGMGLGSLAMASRGFSMAGSQSTGSAGGVVGSGSPIPMDPVEERVMQALAIRQNPDGHPEAARRAADEVLHRIFMGTGVALDPGDHVIIDDSSKSVFDEDDDDGNATSQVDGGTPEGANLVAEMIRNSKLRRRHRALSMAYADIDRIDNTVEASTEYTQMFQDFMDAVDYIQVRMRAFLHSRGQRCRCCCLYPIDEALRIVLICFVQSETGTRFAT